ncbi:MAG: hypothetical protein KBA61_10640 [Spirochaetes bacterium]|nr:hypothetical protein [Spirochaetota bacterium]
MKRTATLLNIILAATLCATALAAQEKIDTPQDFSVFVHGYYLSPRPGLVASAIEHYGSTYAANKSSLPPMIAFFNRIFSDNPGSRAEWKKVIDRQAPELREQLLSALGTGAADFLAGKKISPSLNDMHWGAYFASGEEKYLDGILHVTRHGAERKDLNLFLTGFSAKWSLCSNARQHEKVLKYLLKEQNKQEYRDTVSEILNTEPEVMRKKAIDVISAQKAKGVW